MRDDQVYFIETTARGLWRQAQPGAPTRVLRAELPDSGLVGVVLGQDHVYVVRVSPFSAFKQDRFDPSLRYELLRKPISMDGPVESVLKPRSEAITALAARDGNIYFGGADPVVHAFTVRGFSEHDPAGTEHIRHRFVLSPGEGCLGAGNCWYTKLDVDDERLVSALLWGGSEDSSQVTICSADLDDATLSPDFLGTYQPSSIYCTYPTQRGETRFDFVLRDGHLYYVDSFPHILPRLFGLDLSSREDDFGINFSRSIPDYPFEPALAILWEPFGLVSQGPDIYLFDTR